MQGDKRERLVFGAGMLANLIGAEALNLLTGQAEPALGGRLLCVRPHHAHDAEACRVAQARLPGLLGVERGMIEAPWDLLVSPRTGLVTELSPQHRGPEEPVPPHLFTATLAHFDFRAAPRQERLNAGKGRTEEEAKLSALGEAVERYAAYHLDPTRLSSGPAAPGAITPADCVLYSEAQYAQDGFPFRPWTPDAAISWIGGIDLHSGDAVPLPAALVHLVYPMPRIEDHFTAVTSNGLSAGPTLARAILGGLYEVIERDALMITWMNRLPAIELDAMDMPLPRSDDHPSLPPLWSSRPPAEARDRPASDGDHGGRR